MNLHCKVVNKAFPSRWSFEKVVDLSLQRHVVMETVMANEAVRRVAAVSHLRHRRIRIQVTPATAVTAIRVVPGVLLGRKGVRPPADPVPRRRPIVDHLDVKVSRTGAATPVPEAENGRSGGAHRPMALLHFLKSASVSNVGGGDDPEM